MKQFRLILLLATMLAGTSAWSADGSSRFSIKYQLDGTVSTASATGTVTVSDDGSTATVTVTPKEGNYFETADLSVTMTTSGNLAQSRLRRESNESPSEPVLNPTVSVTKVSGNDITAETKYEFALSSDDNIGYEITANFHQRMSIAEATVTLKTYDGTYTGSEIKPEIEHVKFTDGTVVTYSQDVAYTNNVTVPTSSSAPQPTVTVTGTGKFIGTASTTFTITKATPVLTFSPTTASITFGNESAFTKPSLSITPSGLAVSYSTEQTEYVSVDATSGAISPIKAGSNIEIKATYAGSQNYESVTATYKLTILKGTASVTTAPEAQSLTYNGSTQALVVPGEALNGQMEYKLSTDGSWSTEIPQQKNAAVYTVSYRAVSTNADQFNNSAEGSFTVTILPKSVAGLTVTLTPDKLTYNRENQKPSVSVSDGSTPLVEGTDYELTNAGGTIVGEYSLEVKGKGNYDPSTKVTKTYNITAKAVTPTVTLANPSETLVYDGTEKKPALTVKDGSFELSATDYDVVYSTNINAGELTAKATVTLKGNYSGSKDLNFTIGKTALTITAKSEEFVYDGAAHSNAGYDVQGLIGSDQVSAVVEGSITFPTEGPVVNRVTGYSFITGIAGNYEVTTSDGQLTMRNAGAAITITAASDSWVYDGESHVNPSVTVTSGSLLSGDKLVAVASGVVTYVGDTEEGNNMIEDGYKVMHGDKDVTSNYVITAVAGTLTITPAHFGLSFPVGTVTKQCDDKPFNVTVTSEMAGKVSYSSSDPAVATVDANGTVTIVRAGKTQITGTVYVDDNHATEQASYWLEVKRIMILEGPGTTVSFDGINYFVEMNEDIAPGQVLPEFICDAHLTYTRMLSTEGRTAVSIDGADRYIFTLCLPFAPRFSAKFYTLTGVNGNTLQFDEIEGKAKAYTPYLVSTPHNVAVRNVEATIIHAVTPEGDEMTIPSLTDEEVDGRQYTSEEDISFCRNMVESAPVSGYQLKGTLRGLTNSDAALEGAYILDNDGTWGVVTAGTQAYIPPFRAYVAAPDGQTLPLNSSFGKDSATGIERIVTIDRDGTKHWYDLNGRRIVNGKTNRGLYIHNGKKIVSK